MDKGRLACQEPTAEKPPLAANRDKSSPPPTRALAPGDIVAYVDIQRNGTWHSPPHAHEGFEFIYVIRGHKKILLNGSADSYDASAGDLVIFRPGDVHEEIAESRSLVRMVIRCHPKDLAAAAAAFPPRERLGPVMSLPWRQQFQQLFSRMCAEKARPRTGSDLMLAAYLMEFVAILTRAVEEAPRPSENADDAHRRVRAVVKMLNENMSPTLSLQEMAKTAFMSVSHFSHIFKEETGEAPKQYLIEQRIKHAKRLLRSSALSIQEISRTVGYDNPYYFYRLFRKKTGMTAGAFRRKAKLCMANR